MQKAVAAAARGRVAARTGTAPWVEAEQCFRQAICIARQLGARSVIAAATLGTARLAAQRGDVRRGLQELAEVIGLCAGIGLDHYQQTAERLRSRLEGEGSLTP